MKDEHDNDDVNANSGNGSGRDVSLLIKSFPSEKSQSDEPTLFQLQQNRLFYRKDTKCEMYRTKRKRIKWIVRPTKNIRSLIRWGFVFRHTHIYSRNIELVRVFG